MRFTDLFIRRPVVATVVNLIILLAGYQAIHTLNVRQYLTDEKGIDASRIDLREGASSGRTVEDVLVPQGATYDNSADTPVDATTIHRHGEPYGKPRP